MKDSFVVITIGGSQHIVSVGDVIEVNKIEGKPGDTVTIDDVLLFQNDKGTIVGTPHTGHQVTAEIDSQLAGKKMYIRTYKAKARYRRKKGHRQLLTKLVIKKISKKGTKTTS